MERSSARAAYGEPGATTGRVPNEAHRQRFVEYRRTRSLAQRNRLVVEHQWIAEQCARRFSGRGVSDDDLVQVAYLGLISAVEHFDPEYGASFCTYATPTIEGEIKRHFRDSTWVVKVSRRNKELRSDVRTASERLSQELKHTPNVVEIADHLHVGCDTVRLALQLATAYRPGSLSAPAIGHEHDSCSCDGLPDDIAIAQVRVETQAALAKLDELGRRVIVATFFEDKTQREIAIELGVGQSQVSRSLQRAVRELRRHLESDESPESGTVVRGRALLAGDAVA